jgi:hypothetical protein
VPLEQGDRRHRGSCFATGLSIDAAGNSVVSGLFAGTFDFGGGPIAPIDGDAFYVLKLDPNGSFLWVKQFSAGNGVLALDKGANILLCGVVGPALDLGGGPLTGTMYIGKLDPSGNYVWGFAKTGGLSAGCDDGTTDAQGNFLVTGHYASTIDLGGGPLSAVPAGNNNGAFVASFSPTGAHRFSIASAAQGRITPFSIRADASGAAYVTGGFSGALAFGSTQAYAGLVLDGFLLKVASDGTVDTSKAFGAPRVAAGGGLAITTAGSLVLAGGYSDSIDLGTGPLPTTDPTTAYPFVIEFMP